MARPPSLNAHLYFECVARRGSLSRAAEELSVSPSAVSQQVRLMEEQLGVKLFRRKGRKLSLTLEGEQLFQASATAIRMLREAQAALGQKHEMRRLNLRVSPSFGVRWLGPRLADFLRLHPDWDLRVDAAPDPTDFDREIMDLDIRYGTGAWQGFHAEPVLEDAVLPLVAPSYLASLTPGTPSEMLEQCRLIDSARALCQWDFWLLRNGLDVAANRKKVLMDRSSMGLQLAVDGAGVVLESLALAAGEVAEGRLVPMLPALPVLQFPAYWALCPARHLNRRVVRGFLGWLAEQAEAHGAEVARLVALHGLQVERLDPQEELLRGESG
ncbi:LysR substrate-binding domain-containing protein [Tropicibacter naphthalenivorans]|uniref:Gcv operon activator n=1 Tax=Tropicibacter naphthalenivorans TaxID=441103 RepID=A0A0P1G2G4_9RHOB|nr:LysR substrate-binding domain-containing protein [Tropicibacter naphthalenivorans]CUH76018.1 Gcv operon activator [Tropicibacter naphthalenivorans]SMC40517.1 LysR family transcriptional regulator, glycine cleavage system transcriptional activator [Tropicibacter naphthalenivorans]